MMKNKKIIGICTVTLLLIMLLSMNVFALSYKQDNGIFNYYNGVQVDWEHTVNKHNLQEYIITIDSVYGNIVEPSIILSEFTRGYAELEYDDVSLYLYEETVRTETFNNGSGEYEVEYVDVVETPIVSHLKKNSDYFEVGLDTLEHTGQNKIRKYKLVLTPPYFFEQGDYGVFSLLIDNNEFWDKTHSSDFLISNQIAYYKYDGDATDSTPNGYDASVTGAVIDNNGIINDAYDFSGGVNHITSPNTIFSTGDKTLSLWVKPDVLVDWQVIAGNEGHLTSTSDKGLIIYANVDGSYMTYIGSGAPTAKFLSCQTGASSLVIDTWAHIVAVQDNDELYIYQDGSLVCTDTTTSGSEVAPTAAYRISCDDVGAYCYNGLVDEVGMWGVALDQNNVTFLYNEGAPTEDQQYPYPRDLPTTYNTSLQVFHEDINNVALSSAVYSDIYSVTIPSAVNNSLIAVVIPVTAEKTSGSQANELYYRIVVDGVPQSEKKIVSIPSNGDVRSAVYDAFFLIDEGNTTVDIEVRRTGNGNVDLLNSDITFYSDRTTNGILTNGNINVTVGLNSASATYVNLTSVTLPNGTNNHTYAAFYGQVENNGNQSANDINLRFFGDTGETTTPITRTVDTDTGSIFMINMFYTPDETINVQYTCENDCVINGTLYVFDMTDTDGGIVQTYQNNDIDVSIDDIIMLNTSLLVSNSLSYISTGAATIDLRQALFNVNDTTTEYSQTVSRNFNDGEYGVMSDFHVFDTTVNKYYDSSVDYNETGTGVFSYYNSVVLQGSPLDLTVDSSGDIVLTVNEANGSTISSITGDCNSSNTINSITINDTDWIFSGDADAFSFGYIGADVANTTVQITCTDQYANSESVVRYYTVDTTVPVCTGVVDASFVLGIGENSTFYTWDVDCTDNIGLDTFSVSCDNGYIDINGISGTSYNYNESIELNSTTNCNYSVVDITALSNEYSNTFTVSDATAGLERNLTIFDVDSRLIPFTCGTNYMQFGYLIMFLVLAIGIYWYSYTKVQSVLKPIFCFVSGLMMFVLPFYTVACDLFLSMFLWIFSVAMLYGSLTVGFKSDKDEDD